MKFWYRLAVDVNQANDVEAWREDWSQLHAIAALWCVVEVAVTGVESVVAVIVEDHDVTWYSILDIDLHTELGLLVNAVR